MFFNVTCIIFIVQLRFKYLIKLFLQARLDKVLITIDIRFIAGLLKEVSKKQQDMFFWTEKRKVIIPILIDQNSLFYSKTIFPFAVAIHMPLRKVCLVLSLLKKGLFLHRLSENLCN